MKVGLIGLGVMGRNHLRVLATLPDAEIVAISDPVDAARDAALAVAPAAAARATRSSASAESAASGFSTRMGILRSMARITSAAWKRVGAAMIAASRPGWFNSSAASA